MAQTGNTRCGGSRRWRWSAGSPGPVRRRRELVADRRDRVQEGDVAGRERRRGAARIRSQSRREQPEEQVLVRRDHRDRALGGPQRRPVGLGVVALELGVLPGAGAGRGVVVLLGPDVGGHPAQPVLPHPVRAVAEPGHAGHLRLRVVEVHAEVVVAAGEVVSVVQLQPAAGFRRQRTAQVAGVLGLHHVRDPVRRWLRPVSVAAPTAGRGPLVSDTASRRSPAAASRPPCRSSTLSCRRGQGDPARVLGHRDRGRPRVRHHHAPGVVGRLGDQPTHW